MYTAKPVLDRLALKVDMTGGPDACWPFLGALRPDGYGNFKSSLAATAHRSSWIALVGPLTEGEVIDHLCRNRACCNPDHLEPVSRGENVLRGNTLTAINKAKTHCPRGHEYVTRSNGARMCKPCRNLIDRQKRARDRESGQL